MTCISIENLLDQPRDQWPAAARAHLETCVECQSRLAAEQAWRAAFADLPVEPMSQDFTDRAFARVSRVHETDDHTGRARTAGFHHWFGAGFAGAAVAGLALWALLTVLQPWGAGSSAHSFELALHQQQDITLAFNAPNDIQGVNLSVQLPENFELAGHKGKRTLSWTTDLKKGRNVLRLPVVAVGQGQGQLVAKLSRKQTVKTIRLQLISKNKDMSSQGVVEGVSV